MPGFDIGVRAFTYTVAMQHFDQDSSFLCQKLNALVNKQRDQWRASLLQSEEPFIPPSDELPRTPSGELSVIPPPLEVHPEQVIKGDLVVQIEENDRNGDDLEQIDDPKRVLDQQDG